MYCYHIIHGATEVDGKYPYSNATCIQVEDWKEYGAVKIEKQIASFIYNNWYGIEDWAFVDNWWRADNIDAAKWTFDIVINGTKKWYGRAYLESWSSIKRVS